MRSTSGSCDYEYSDASGLYVVVDTSPAVLDNIAGSPSADQGHVYSSQYRRASTALQHSLKAIICGSSPGSASTSKAGGVTGEYATCALGPDTNFGRRCSTPAPRHVDHDQGAPVIIFGMDTFPQLGHDLSTMSSRARPLSKLGLAVCWIAWLCSAGTVGARWPPSSISGFPRDTSCYGPPYEYLLPFLLPFAKHASPCVRARARAVHLLHPVKDVAVR